MKMINPKGEEIYYNVVTKHDKVRYVVQAASGRRVNVPSRGNDLNNNVYQGLNNLANLIQRGGAVSSQIQFVSVFAQGNALYQRKLQRLDHQLRGALTRGKADVVSTIRCRRTIVELAIPGKGMNARSLRAHIQRTDHFAIAIGDGGGDLFSRLRQLNAERRGIHAFAGAVFSRKNGRTGDHYAVTHQ